MRTVVGVFATRQEADAALRDLNAIGIPPDEVAIAEPGEMENHEQEWSRRNLCAAGATAWGWMFAGLIPRVVESSLGGAIALGSTVGAVAGAVAGLLFNAIHVSSAGVTRTAVADHPVFSALVGLMIAGICGALIAADYNMGVSHERKALARRAEIDQAVVLAAHVAEKREPDALDVMHRRHAKKATAGADCWAASGWTGAHPNDRPYPSDSEYRSHTF